MSLTMYAKEFLAMHFAFDEFAHILWGVKKPTIVMTDNKSLTRFFQSKRLPPKLWNYCDQALQFNFVLADVPVVENPAADYRSRLNINPKDRIHLKLHDEIPVFKVEMYLASKTPGQDDDEEEYIPDETNVPDAITSQTRRCNHSWRYFLDGVTKTRNSTIDAMTISRPRCNRL